MIKKIALALAIVVIAIAGAVYYFASNLDSIVKAAVERYGSEATQARVSLKAVELAPTSGTGRMQGLVVGNPKGFSTPEAISLGDIKLTIDITSLQSNPIVIKEVLISQPSVTYEYSGQGSNLETIQKNVQAYAAKFGGGQSSTSASASQGGDERKIVIDRLSIEKGSIDISHAALQGRSLSSPLPTIELRNIGRDKGGATPAEVAEKVLGTISAQASKIASSDLQKQIGNLVKDQAGAVGGAVGGAASGATDRLKGLLGK